MNLDFVVLHGVVFKPHLLLKVIQVPLRLGDDWNDRLWLTGVLQSGDFGYRSGQWIGGTCLMCCSRTPQHFVIPLECCLKLICFCLKSL